MSVTRAVVVIGASGGIGHAIAEHVSKEAAVTLGYYQNKGPAVELVQNITSTGGQASTHQVDISDHNSVQAFLEAAEADWGRIDSIIVATGPSIPICPIVDVSHDLFKSVIDTEVIGAFNVVKAGVEMLRHQPGSNKSILFVLSTALLRTLDYDGLSYIPKMAVQGIIRQTAREVGGEGLRLNGVGIGGFNTGAGERVDLEDKYVRAIVKDVQIPSGRMGSRAEIASVAAFLISDGATYVNGQILGVDGGCSA